MRQKHAEIAVAALNMAGKIMGGDKYGGILYPRHKYPT